MPSERERESFTEWLRDRGAEVLAPTNPYEWVRFRANGGTHIIYLTGKGNLSRKNDIEAMKAYHSCIENKSWDAGVKTPNPIKGTKRSTTVSKLLERDGDKCFFCGADLKDDITLEHLLSRAHGGGNHIEGLVLSHDGCNKKASHMSVMEKIRLREDLMIYGGCPR